MNDTLLSPTKPIPRAVAFSRRYFVRHTLLILFLVFGVAFWWSVKDLNPNSRLYPQVLIAILVLFGVLQISTDMKAGGQTADQPLPHLWGTWKKTVGTLLLTGILLVLMPHLGFYEVAPFYLWAVAVLIAGGRWLTGLAFAAGFTIGIYLVFTVALSVRFPPGALGIG